jgi:hypothetical protein
VSAIDRAIRIIAAANAGLPPAPEDAMAMAAALQRASEDEGRPVEAFLGLRGNWRAKIGQVRRLAACEAVDFLDGETCVASILPLPERDDMGREGDGLETTAACRRALPRQKGTKDSPHRLGTSMICSA